MTKWFALEKTSICYASASFRAERKKTVKQPNYSKTSSMWTVFTGRILQAIVSPGNRQQLKLHSGAFNLVVKRRNRSICWCSMSSGILIRFGISSKNLATTSSLKTRAVMKKRNHSIDFQNSQFTKDRLIVLDLKVSVVC